jgi:hypothetical protein
MVRRAVHHKHMRVASDSIVFHFRLQLPICSNLIFPGHFSSGTGTLASAAALYSRGRRPYAGCTSRALPPNAALRASICPREACAKPSITNTGALPVQGGTVRLPVYLSIKSL